MQLESKELCPHLKKKCIKGDCVLFKRVIGKNPQTGADVDEYDCAHNWQVILLIENTQQQRKTSAAIESFRNAMVASNEATLLTLASAQQATLLGAPQCA